MEVPSRFTIGIILIGVALHHCHGYEAKARVNGTSEDVTPTTPSLERFRRLIPYMTYYVAQNLAYQDTQSPVQTGYLVPAYLIAGTSPRRPQGPPSAPPSQLRSLQSLPAALQYDYPYRRYKPQPLRNVDNDRLRLLIQQQKQKQLFQLFEDERRAQQLRLQEQQVKLFQQQLEEERRAKQLQEERKAAQLQEQRVAQLQEERRAAQLQEQRAAQLQDERRAAQLQEERRAAQLQEERRAAQLQEQRTALLQEERRAVQLQEERRVSQLQDERRTAQFQEDQRAVLLQEQRAAQLQEERLAAQLQEERRAAQLQEERRAKQLQLFLEEERRAKLQQSRPPVEDQQLVVPFNDVDERVLLRAKEQADVETAAAVHQRQQYDALLQSHNEQELANSIVPTPPTLVQITSPKTVSKLVHHIAANLKKSNELLTTPPAVSAAHFDVSIKSVLRLLAELQRTKAIPVTSAKVAPGKEAVPVSVKTKTGVITQTFPATTLEGSTPGRLGIDYPAYDTIPTTTFSCQTQRYKGFFGDPETNCQVWHYCDLNGGQASFLCPNGTIFSQVALTCDWWFNVRCSSTAQLYVLNERLYKYILPMKPSFPEDYSGPVVDRYLVNKLKEMQQEKKAEAEAEAQAEAQAEADKGDKGEEEGVSTDSPPPPTTQLTLEDDSRENYPQKR